MTFLQLKGAGGAIASSWSEGKQDAPTVPASPLLAVTIIGCLARSLDRQEMAQGCARSMEDCPGMPAERRRHRSPASLWEAGRELTGPAVCVRPRA